MTRFCEARKVSQAFLPANTAHSIQTKPMQKDVSSEELSSSKFVPKAVSFKKVRFVKDDGLGCEAWPGYVETNICK